VGHVQVVKVAPFEAEVTPCAYRGMRTVAELPERGQAEWALRTFGSLRLSVAAEVGNGRAAGNLAGELRKLASGPGALFQVARPGAKADWLLQEHKGQVVLAAAGPAAATPTGPYRADQAPKLAADLNQIARARNLLRLGAPELDPSAGARVEVSMFQLKHKKDPKGVKLSWQADGLRVKHGDVLAWQVTNRGSEPVDVTVLFVDATHGIQAVFPARGTAGDNRLAPGATVRVGPGTVNAEKSSGWEHLVVIAVRAEGPYIDFTFLEQPSLPQAVARAATTPLGLLLQNAMFAKGQTRSMRYQAMADYTMRRLSWQVLPKGP
jgi:hypothetical protein